MNQAAYSIFADSFQIVEGRVKGQVAAGREDKALVAAVFHAGFGVSDAFDGAAEQQCGGKVEVSLDSNIVLRRQFTAHGDAYLFVKGDAVGLAFHHQLNVLGGVSAAEEGDKPAHFFYLLYRRSNGVRHIFFKVAR